MLIYLVSVPYIFHSILLQGTLLHTNIILFLGNHILVLQRGVTLFVKVLQNFIFRPTHPCFLPLQDFSGRGFVMTRIVGKSCYVWDSSYRYKCPYFSLLQFIYALTSLV